MFEFEKKYYLSDVWFKNFLSSNYDLWNSKKLENYVFLLLKKYWYEISVGKIWDLEIDFIAEKWKNTQFIQVCRNITDEVVFQREVSPFFKIDEKKDFYLITNDKKINWKYKWIEILDIQTFEENLSKKQ